MNNSFNARTSLDVNGQRYQIFALDALRDQFDLARLPVTLKILLETYFVQRMASMSLLVISRLWPVGVRVRQVPMRQPSSRPGF